MRSRIAQDDDRYRPPTWLSEEYHQWWDAFALAFPMLVISGWKVSIPAFKKILMKYHYEVYRNIFGEWKTKFDRIEKAKKDLEIILAPYVDVDDIRTRDEDIVIVLEEDDKYLKNITPHRLFGVDVIFSIGDEFWFNES